MGVTRTKRRAAMGVVVTTTFDPKPAAAAVAAALGGRAPVIEQRALYRSGKRIASTTVKRRA